MKIKSQKGKAFNIASSTRKKREEIKKKKGESFIRSEEKPEYMREEINYFLHYLQQRQPLLTFLGNTVSF